MAREGQVNTFNDGLNKDLNSLLTPNSVMTDCLNGTIITYNGNEFALQNDLGNYRFNHGMLHEGFVPVGIKEHANILYIISYNPILDEVEVGSFPSMKTLYTSEINNIDKTDELKLPNTWNLYSEVLNSSQLTLLSDLKEDYKLNPGDKYYAGMAQNSGESWDDTLKHNKIDLAWQGVSTFVLTENNKLYNIDSFIEYGTWMDDTPIEKFKDVTWDVPGWLAVKTTPNVMKEFNCYISDISTNHLGDESTVSATIKVQSIWDHIKYNHITNDTYDCNGINLSLFETLGYAIVTYDGSEEFIKNGKIDWLSFVDTSDESDLVKKQIDESVINHRVSYNDQYDVIYSVLDINDSSNSFVAVVPVLKVNDDGEWKYIFYDQFTTVMQLEKEVFAPEDVEIASEMFKYYVDKNGITFNLDVSSTFDSVFQYRILSHNGETIIDWVSVEDFNYSGQNIFNIIFRDEFVKEDLYILELRVLPINLADLSIDDNYKKAEELVAKYDNLFKSIQLYASEVVNYYYKLYDNYNSEEFVLNETSFAEAAVRWIKVKNPLDENKINKIENKYSYVIKDKDGVTNGEFYPDNLKLQEGSFNGFFDQSYSTVKTDFNKTIKFNAGTSYSWDIERYDLILPEGDGKLWSNISLKDLNITVVDNNNIEHEFINNGATYTLNVGIESEIYADNYNIMSRYYPSESQIRDFGFYNDSPVKYEGDGVWSINKAAYIHQDKIGVDFSIGTIEVNGSLKFKVVDNNTINVWRNNKEYKFEYYDQNWHCDSFWNNEQLFKPASYENGYNWVSSDGTGRNEDMNCSREFNRRLKVPFFTVLYNTYDKRKKYEIRNGMNSYYSEAFNGKKLYDSDDEKRVFATISINSSSSKDFAWNIFNNFNGDWIDDEYLYLTTVLGNYMIMINYIKYCTGTTLQSLYIPIWECETINNNNLFIDTIIYNSEGFNWSYDNNSLFDISSIKNYLLNSNYEYSEPFDVKFSNSSDFSDPTSHIENLAYQATNEAEHKAEQYVVMNSHISNNSIFLDERYDNSIGVNLLSLVDNMDWDPTIGFTINKDVETNPDYEIKMRNSDNNYPHVTNVLPNYAFNE